MDNSLKKAGVVGFPVSHSLSPRLHGYWLKKYNIAGEYKAYEVKPEELEKFVTQIREDKNFCGFNLTIPHKETIIKYFDEIDEVAQRIGAVNTVIIKNGKLYGTNTDTYGFAKNIKAKITTKNKAVVLGAGGAAKAVLNALVQLGFKEIVITNRSRQRAAELSSVASCQLSVVDWEERSKALENADLLVNTTSLGMKNNPPLEMDLSLLSKAALVTDIVYSPLITPLLESAEQRGNPIVTGIGMLLHQAVPAFEAWFGTRPEVTEKLENTILQD